jgi:eukaryotic-like serine/threonine-protein kinase
MRLALLADVHANREALAAAGPCRRAGRAAPCLPRRLRRLRRRPGLGGRPRARARRRGDARTATEHGRRRPRRDRLDTRAAGSGSAAGVIKRWLASLREHAAVEGGAGAQSARSPIVLAAIDTAAEPALREAVRDTALRLLETEPGVRLACLTVMRINRIGMDELLDADGTSRHLNLLIALRHWGRPLLRALRAVRGGDGEAAARITFHVLEAVDPAAAIVEYARRNQIDHIVTGARSSGRLRRHLGSVSTRVVAESDRSVTVVRATSGAA